MRIPEATRTPGQALLPHPFAELIEFPVDLIGIPFMLFAIALRLEVIARVNTSIAVYREPGGKTAMSGAVPVISPKMFEVLPANKVQELVRAVTPVALHLQFGNLDKDLL